MPENVTVVLASVKALHSKVKVLPLTPVRVQRVSAVVTPSPLRASPEAVTETEKLAEARAAPEQMVTGSGVVGVRVTAHAGGACSSQVPTPKTFSRLRSYESSARRSACEPQRTGECCKRVQCKCLGAQMCGCKTAAMTNRHRHGAGQWTQACRWLIMQKRSMLT